MAIPLTSESAPAPAALIDGDQKPFVERGPELVALVREAEDPAVERSMAVARGGREGKRVDYRCVVCGYGIVVYGRPPGCPMCREARWQHVEPHRTTAPGYEWMMRVGQLVARPVDTPRRAWGAGDGAAAKL